MNRVAAVPGVPRTTAARPSSQGRMRWGIGGGNASRLTAAGAEVILLVRNPRKDEAAVSRIREKTRGADV